MGSRRLAIALLAMLGAAGVMLLTSGQMSDLRGALPALSHVMNWLEFLPVPFDMDHVVFFALVAAGLRILLPDMRWWTLLLVLAALAAGTELLQFATVGRTPKLLDARDDMIGAGIGLLLGSVPLWCAGQAPVILRWSTGFLLAGIALLPFQQWPVASAFGFPVLPSDALFVCALALRLFALASDKAPIRISGFHGWLLAYVGAMLLAALVLPPLRISAVTNGFTCLLPSPAFGLGLAKWVGICWLVTIAALACDAATNATWRRPLVQAWLLGAVLASLAAWAAVIGFYMGGASSPLIALLLSHYGSLPPGPYPRVVGVFANANMAGLFLLLSLAIGLAAHHAGGVSKRSMLALLVVVSVPLLATASQAIGAAVLLGAWWWFRHGAASRVLRTAVLGIGALLSVAILALLLVNPAAPFVVPSVRMQLWYQAWLAWQGAFWRGTGLGQPAALLDYLAPDGAWQHLTDAHNIVLNLGAQGGVIAVAAFVGLVSWTWHRTRGLAVLSAGRIGLLLAVAYLGIGGSFEDARVLWVFMGLLAGVAAAQQRMPGIGTAGPGANQAVAAGS